MVDAMARKLSPQEAQDLVAQGDIDIVDVREGYEWVDGHVPGARLVPLDMLGSDPKALLPHDRILFVCSQGVRCQAASQIAEAIGHQEVYSLAGGTTAWADAGLPLRGRRSAAKGNAWLNRTELPRRADQEAAAPAEQAEGI
jgi:rhodanese-related sulfurtransferase